MDSYQFGMVGLGVMGRNFLLNVADHGFSVAGLDRSEQQVASLLEAGAGKTVFATTDKAQFVAHLASPRTIMLLVPAGAIVDQVIEDLLPLLQPGDLIIDGGNSHFNDTIRRAAYLQGKGLLFMGAGVSGGEEGARRGPSIMPGGDEAAWHRVQPIFEAVSAKVQGDPCVAYMGLNAAGHYVKMVHNGIEYALMQLIAEAYDVLQTLGGFDNAALHEIFSTWNEGPLKSYLIEITADIFKTPDPEGSGALVDAIKDQAKQKGTGKWTSQSALDLGVPIPSIDAAVSMRGLSSFWEQRQRAASFWPLPEGVESSINRQDLIAITEQALWAAYLIAYAQGMHLLKTASTEMGMELRLLDAARIWRGGCIIRAELLEDIRQALEEEPTLDNLILSPVFRDGLATCIPALRLVCSLATQAGLPALALSASLHYFQAWASARLPLNLVQAQRDYFGAHTYERLDRAGSFHTDWDA